jgi:hypothetical protein
LTSGYNGIVSSVGTARKITAGATVLGRMVRVTRGGRFASAALAGARATLASFAHTLHLFLLQTTGLFFAVFAAIGGVAAIREYQKYAAGQATAGRIALAAGFAVVFAYFAVSSFVRASRKAK